jgi:hypothetical protein
MTPQEAQALRDQDKNAWGNKATIDWRDLPNAQGYTYWQIEEAKKTGKVLPVAERVPQMMTISKIPPNKKLVEATDKNGTTQTVEVGNNKDFAIGDEIKVGPHESGYADVWTLLSGKPTDKRRPENE